MFNQEVILYVGCCSRPVNYMSYWRLCFIQRFPLSLTLVFDRRSSHGFEKTLLKATWNWMRWNGGWLTPRPSIIKTRWSAGCWPAFATNTDARSPIDSISPKWTTECSRMTFVNGLISCFGRIWVTCTLTLIPDYPSEVALWVWNQFVVPWFPWLYPTNAKTRPIPDSCSCAILSLWPAHNPNLTQLHYFSPWDCWFNHAKKKNCTTFWGLLIRS